MQYFDTIAKARNGSTDAMFVAQDVESILADRTETPKCVMFGDHRGIVSAGDICCGNG